MRNSVERSWKKTLSYRRFCLNLYGRRQAQRNRRHVWASLSSQTLDLSLNSTPSKNRAQKPAEMVQYSIIRECVLWVTALTSYVTANSSNWEMQKQMDGTFLDLLPMCPRKRLRATNICPGRSLATIQKLSLGKAVMVSNPLSKGMIKDGDTDGISFSIPEERH